MGGGGLYVMKNLGHLPVGRPRAHVETEALPGTQLPLLSSSLSCCKCFFFSVSHRHDVTVHSL